jgi:hypothetical protein
MRVIQLAVISISLLTLDEFVDEKCEKNDPHQGKGWLEILGQQLN